MKKIVCLFVCLWAGAANAGVIIASADSNIQGNSTFFNNVFGGQNVVGFNSAYQSWALDNWDTQATQNASSYSQSQSITSASLVGADWLIAASAAAYSAASMQVIADFFNAGGNVWVGGEASVYGSHGAANQLLSYLGSGMSLDNIATSSYNNLATNTGLDVYTAGTAAYSNAYSSLVSGGTALYAYQGNSLISIERGDSSPSPVPEPTSLALLAIGLMGFGFSRINRVKTRLI